MCHYSCTVFGLKNLTKEEIAGKRILEVGSYDVNGSLRPILENFNPKEYIGIDIEKGPGVDLVMSAEEMVNNFGKNSFDIVISTELLEHVKNWREIISNIKNVCKPGGLVLITTRSHGFPYHPFPEDYWRYEAEDMRQIFSDCEIIKIEKDKQVPGIFIKLKKPPNFIENDLRDFKLYNIIFDKKITRFKTNFLDSKYTKYLLKKMLRKNLVGLGNLILRKLK